MIEEDDLERMPVQLVAKEAIARAMETPLRKPIVEAVENATGERVAAPVPEGESTTEDAVTGGAPVEDAEPTTGADQDDDGEAVDAEANADGEAEADGGSGRSLVQGLVAFLVLFGVLYVALQKLGGDEE